MNEQLRLDQEQLDSLLEQVKLQGLDYLKNITNRLTSNETINFNPAIIPHIGHGTIETLKQFNQRFEPLIVASSGPRYWGFVTGGTTPASIVGDWFSSIYDQNPQNHEGHGDISAIIEQETIQLLLQLLNLPNSFLGGFVTGATMSNFTSLAVARQWIGKQHGRDIAKEGVIDAIPIITSTPHSSSIKSLSLLGLGSKNFISIKTEEGNREAMSIIDLEEKIIALGQTPFILISSAGTVNTVDFDDFLAIAQLKQKYNFWWHIDAAFGGFAACSSQYKHLVEGWEYADSITVDCHKWLNVPYDSAVFFIKQEHQILQIETFQNSNAPYLGDPLENFSYLNFLPENSRRLRALPAWFTLNAYGKNGYAEIIDRNIEVAKLFGDFIGNNSYFKLLAPVRLNTVCYTLQKEENTTHFLNKLNDTGTVFMTPTIYNKTQGIRAAFVNWQTTQKDIEIVIKTIKKILS